MENDTIAAIATPPGQGGIGIIRISGEDAERILRTVFSPPGGWKQAPESHRMVYGGLYDEDELIDEGMAVLMRAPRSYTRENVAELQLHGGTFVLQRALDVCIRHGARLAQPGEFTRRAFLNGRIDLSRAEAVMSMIAARGEQSRRAAVREMEGGVTAFVRRASDQLYALQAGLAACMDYPEEIPDEEGTAEMVPQLRQLIRDLENASNEHASRLLRDGFQIALVGRPNAGKSSLLNALLGEERAIVTEIPGTTRDLIQGEVNLDGARILLTDTAGLRGTEDPVERIGVQRSEKAMRDADLILLVLDGSNPNGEETIRLLKELPEHSAVLINKTDLPQRISTEDIQAIRPDLPCFSCSALETESLEEIKNYLREKTTVTDRMTLTQPRQLDAVRRALGFLRSALRTVQELTPDMASTDLQAAQEALAEITGDRADEKLLDTVFSSFCVGK